MQCRQSDEEQRTEEELKRRTEEEGRTLELRSGRLNEERWLIERWSSDLKRNDLQCRRMKKNNSGSEELEEEKGKSDGET